MSRKIHISVAYGCSKKGFTCERSEFLSQVAKHFNIKENEIEIYDPATSNRIDIDNLKEVMKVEVKIKNARKRTSTLDKPNPFAQIIQKLKNNAILAGPERSLLVNLLSDNRVQCLQNNEKSTKNAKLQVNLQNVIPQRSVECQTDKIFETATKRNLENNDVMYQSKRLASSEKIDAAKAKLLMDELYDERRSFILVQLPLAGFVKEKYPLLFSLAEVRNEIDRILHIGKCVQFLKNIEKYSRHILSLARENDPLLLTIKRKIASYSTVVQKKYALQVGSLLMISPLMHEGRGYLKLIDQPIESTLLPYIEANAKLEDIFSNDFLFAIYVENTQVCTTKDFPEALLCLMGCYFIFSVEYPNNIWDTLVTIERLYLELTETNANRHVRQIVKSLQLLAAHENRISFKDLLKA